MFLATLACIPQARAEILILGSTPGAGLAIGAVLPDEATLEVPEGESVRIMTPAGKTRLVDGPASHSVRALAGGGAADTALWGEVARHVAVGREPAPRRALSATRGAAPEPEDDLERSGRGATGAPGASARVAAPAAQFSWVNVPVTAESNVCVAKGSTLALVRASGGAAETIEIAELPSGQRATVVFPDRSTQVLWPAALAPRTGAYVVRSGSRPGRQMTLRLIAPLPSDEEILRVLHSQRCDLQRNALLDAMRDPAFQVSSNAE